MDASQIDEASQWCLRNGYKSVWGAAAVSSVTGRTSGGTFLLVRKQLGLAKADDYILPSDRMVAGKVDIPGYRQLLVTSTYFETGVGMKALNVELTRAIKVAHDKWDGPAVVGGDFNNTPEELAANLAGSRSGTKITAPYAPRGTCSGTGGGRTIDFFLVTADLSLGIAEVRVDYMAGLAPHRPVDLYLLANMASWRVRKLSKPPTLPTKHVIGPSWQEKGWTKVQEEIKELTERENSGAISAGDRRGLANAILHKYADLAEAEITANGGESKEKKNLRCRGAYVTWQPILQDRPPQPARILAACRWTKQVVNDIERANSGARTEVDGLLYGLEKAKEAAKGDQKLLALMTEVIKLAREWRTITADETKGHLSRLAVGIDAEVEAKITAEKNEGLAAWRKWLKEDADMGNGHAHAYSRMPQEWIPKEAKGDDGILTGDPTQLMAEDRTKFATLWNSADEAKEREPRYGKWDPSDDLRKLDGDDILEGAKSFSHGTSSTYDGLHPRHFAMLSGQGRETTARLLEFFEHTGEWPDGINEVVISLIPKATGGTRPIGLFSGLYRLWTRVRKAEATEWERVNGRSYFAARGGNGALDTVWQQAFRAERNAGKGGASAAVLIDLKSFYDHFDYDLLQARADEGGFKKKLTNLALKGYAAGRRIMQEGMVADPIFSGRGVVAGCGFATTWVKIYCKGPLDAFQKRHPLVRLDTYVDDFTLSVDAGTDLEARVLVTRAALDLKKVIENELKCKLALDKSVVVASNDKLAQEIADDLGTLGVVPRAATPNLGVDFSVGKKRKSQGAASSKRAGRFQKGVARKKRVKKVRRAVGGKQAGIVAATGLVVATEYGAAVNGIDDAELHSLRKIGASGMSPSAGGRSLTALMILKGDPAWRAATAPISQWVKVAWQDKNPMHCLKLVTLNDLREAYIERKGVKERLWTVEGKRKWKEVRGPIDALDLSLDRISWSTDDGVSFTDDLGVQRTLLEHSPGQWQAFLRDSIQRMHERELGRKTGSADLKGLRACLDIVRNVFRSSKTTPEGKNLLAVNTCNGLWTKCRASNEGYVVESTLCELCGEHPDTVHQRLWHCNHPRVAEARNKVASKKVQEAAKRAGPTSALYNRGFLPHPADDLPKAEEKVIMQLRSHGKVISRSDFELEGDLFLDGSCDQHPIKELRRASWAVTKINKEGVKIASACGPVPACLPQTSQGGEYTALAGAVTLMSGASDLFGDCQNVVKNWAKGSNNVKGSKQVYQEVIDGAQKQGHISSFVWVKAHQSLSAVKSLGDADKLYKAQGNDAADKQADDAMKMHPQRTTEAENKLKTDMAHAKEVCKVIAAVLPLWPRLARTGIRKVKDEGEAASRAKSRDLLRHNWTKLPAGKWYCPGCLGTTRNSVLSEKRRKGTCPGRPDKLAVDAQEEGHLKHVAECEGRDLTICIRCGAWGQQKTVKLAGVCNKVPTLTGTDVLHRVLVKRVHPKRNSGVTLSPALEAEAKERSAVPRSTARVKKLVAQAKKGSDTWDEESRRATSTSWGSGCPDSAAEEAAIRRETIEEVPFDDTGLDDDDFFGTGTAAAAPSLSAAQKKHIADKREAALVKREALRRRSEENKARAVAERPAILKRKHAAELAKSKKGWETAKRASLAKGAEADNPADFSVDYIIEDEERKIAERQKRETESLAARGSEGWQAASSADRPQPGTGGGTTAAAATATRTSAPRGKVYVEEWEVEGLELPPPKKKGLFPFVLKALGATATTASEAAAYTVVPKLPQVTALRSEACTAVEEDSSSSSDGEMELALDPCMESSFVDFLRNQAETVEENRQPDGSSEPATAQFASELETEKLLDLLDLEEAGEAVSWPEGLDSRIASLIVKGRTLARGAAAQSLQGLSWRE